MSRPETEQAIRRLASHYEPERSEAVEWLLSHPDEAQPALIAAVRVGTGRAPELCMRLLAKIDGPGAADALEQALLRGHAGESLYAAVALGEMGEVGRQVLREHREHPLSSVRDAATHVLQLPS